LVRVWVSGRHDDTKEYFNVVNRSLTPILSGLSKNNILIDPKDLIVLDDYLESFRKSKLMIISLCDELEKDPQSFFQIKNIPEIVINNSDAKAALEIALHFSDKICELKKKIFKLEKNFKQLVLVGLSLCLLSLTMLLFTDLLEKYSVIFHVISVLIIIASAIISAKIYNGFKAT
jgi:hypothetical protein